SGSFLIEVYSVLLEYHDRWYNANKGKAKKGDVFERDGHLHLSLKKKKEILTNNVYGVDIDFQATEVTQLSLYLKLLENVSMNETYQMGMFKETILPNLNNNIVCGNSLIGTDIGGLFESEETDKLKPMNYEDVFPNIMKKGGFDAIVGNPPYVFGRDWKSLGIPDDVKKYFLTNYKWSPYQLDMFSLFMERSFMLSKYGSRIGQIVPNVWLNNTYSKLTRNSLLKNAANLIIAIPPGNVFKGITVDTTVYTYCKQKNFGSKFEIRAIDYQKLSTKTEFKVEEYLDGERPISISIDNIGMEFIYALKKDNPQLSEFADITRGVHPYRLGGFGKSAYGKGAQVEKDLTERPYHSKVLKKGYRSFIYGKDLKRFSPVIAKEYVNYGDWLAEPRQPKYFEGERVYSRKILGDRLVVTIAKDNNVADQQVYITKPKKEYPKAVYFAGIMGSKLISFFVRTYYNETNDAFPQIKVGQLQSLPIRAINVANSEDKSRHDNIVKLVEQMLEAKQKLSTAKTDGEVNRLELLCASLDRKIDEAVYELYGLTEEEIKIVEGK
ncbi:MAG: TaqI-like C-terminal specificity domain-containing protein, partial [Bacteroidota bacterium]|nr:TaqI-like C-terminal specificity domain-containing protein [Bacteroidota bacterium]